MNHSILGAPARLALALGLVASAGLILPSATPSAATRGVEMSSPPAVATATDEPERISLAQADADPEERPVSFSSEQADRGEEKYDSDCKECHGDDLRGGLNGGAPISGMAFVEKYGDGAPASGLFGFMSSTMPPNAPGRYSAETYADLMAYILKQNGFQPGAPLPADLDALDALIMEK